ncbi:hypothetical protein [Clostridium rectalis]|uniref:hypothetical protein n=1 Tax=Clostridium rectalis TaxID=2040295 RepID=UPI000F63C29C|nr:hypothetical protein [Clostridium rectalis]
MERIFKAMLKIKGKSYIIFLIILGALMLSFNFIGRVAAIIIILIEANKSIIKFFISTGCSRKKYYISRLLYCILCSFIILVIALILNVKFNYINCKIISDNFNIIVFIFLFLSTLAVITSAMLIDILSVSQYEALNIFFILVYSIYFIFSDSFIILKTGTDILQGIYITLTITLVNIVLSYKVLPTVEIN